MHYFWRYHLLISALLGRALQQDVRNCQYVTIPVCGDDQVTTSLADLRNTPGRGPVGAPGKMGPRGFQGPKGQNGETGPSGIDGQNASPREIEELVNRKVREIQLNLMTMSGSDFCKTSSEGIHLVHGELFLCDGQGWTVIQHRRDGSGDFSRTWNDYKDGFGSLDGEFWLGLQTLHNFVRGRRCSLRVELKSFDQERAYAEYSSFSVEDEGKKFRLSVTGYNGTAGDSMTFSDGMMFTTKDSDNDRHGGNCATLQHGGWWFNNCFRAFPNAPWGRSSGKWTKIIWYTWKGDSEALDSTKMKIRCN